MAVSKKLKSFYFSFFEKPEIFTANVISKLQERRNLKKNINKNYKLTKEQKKEIKAFWAPYKRVSSRWAKYYAAANGSCDPRYIPNDLYYTVIDQHFNNRKLGYGFNDKNYYSKIFAGIPQPDIAVRKINGMIFDREYSRLSPEEAKCRILSEDEMICKPSQETGSGRGIMFFNKSDEKKIDEFLNDPTYDNYVVQSLIKQHSELDKVHKGSVNCIRICSLLMDDGVHILSSVLRMGFGNSKVDNATAKDNKKYDGMSCGICSDGCLKKYAHGYNTGACCDQHPDGLVFEGFKVPSYDKAVELVRKAHPIIGNFRLVSWDIAIDESGEPVLIEANMRKGGINFHQFNNGPLFGDLTERVLDEVFHK
jgi:hypothetical protein